MLRLNLETNSSQAMNTACPHPMRVRTPSSALGMRNGLGRRIARAVHAFQTFERLAQRVQAVQAFRREDEHAAVPLVSLGQRHFVVVRPISVEQFLRGLRIRAFQNRGWADVPLLFAYGVFRTGEYHHDAVVAVIDGLLHRNRIGDAAVVIGGRHRSHTVRKLPAPLMTPS